MFKPSADVNILPPIVLLVPFVKHVQKLVAVPSLTQALNTRALPAKAPGLGMFMYRSSFIVPSVSIEA